MYKSILFQKFIELLGFVSSNYNAKTKNALYLLNSIVYIKRFFVTCVFLNQFKFSLLDFTWLILF